MTDTGYSEKCVISTGVQFKAKSANVDVYQYGIHVIIYFFQNDNAQIFCLSRDFWIPSV